MPPLNSIRVVIQNIISCLRLTSVCRSHFVIHSFLVTLLNNEMEIHICRNPAQCAHAHTRAHTHKRTYTIHTHMHARRHTYSRQFLCNLLQCSGAVVRSSSIQRWTKLQRHKLPCKPPIVWVCMCVCEHVCVCVCVCVLTVCDCT